MATKAIKSEHPLSCEEIATELNFLPRSSGSSIIIQGENWSILKELKNLL